MKIRENILTILILMIFSCNGKNKKPEPYSEPKIEAKTELKIASKSVKNYSVSARLFAEEILKENIRIHSFDLSNSKKPKHLKIFKSNGLEKIEAYSNKNYPQKSNPNYYEHFTLFVATYKNEKSAENNFKQIKSDTKYGFYKAMELGIKLSERTNSLHIGAKPGGMITQKGKQIFSLVETCRGTPTGENWIEYENKFLKFITEKNEEIEILNANCGGDNYFWEKRKPAHNNVYN